MDYRIISADCHIDMTWMPGNLWVEHAPAKWRDQVPQVRETAEGPKWYAEGKELGVFGGLGFVGGGLFSTVLVMSDGRRRFDQLAIPRFTALGAVGGLLLGALVTVTGFVDGLPFGYAIVGSVTALLGATSAACTLAIARRSEDDALLRTSEEVGKVGLGQHETHDLLRPVS